MSNRTKGKWHGHPLSPYITDYQETLIATIAMWPDCGKDNLNFIVTCGTVANHLDEQGIDGEKAIELLPKLMAMLPEIIYFYKEEIETIGGCDHSVGICCCNDIKNLELLESYRANMKLKEV